MVIMTRLPLARTVPPTGIQAHGLYAVIQPRPAIRQWNNPLCTPGGTPPCIPLNHTGGNGQVQETIVSRLERVG